MNVNEPPVLKRGKRIWHTFAILNCLNYVPLVPETLQSPKTKFEDLCHILPHQLFVLGKWNNIQGLWPLKWQHVWEERLTVPCLIEKIGRTGRSDLIIRRRLERCCHVWWVSFVCTSVCLERLVFPCVPNMFHCEWNIGRKMIHFGIREKFWNQPDTVPTSHSKVAF